MSWITGPGHPRGLSRARIGSGVPGPGASLWIEAAGYAPWLTLVQKTELLAAPDVAARLELLVGWVRDHLAEQDVTERINTDVREGLEKSQREFPLRQQLAAIRKELGEDEPDGSADYRSRVEAAELPDKVREAALREVGRLDRASDASPEAGWIRTWLDTALEMPWTTRTEDITQATRRRTTRSATTTSKSTSTCRTSSSWRPPMSSTPSPGRCSTGWNW